MRAERSKPRRPNPAQRAEPRGIGTAGARDPLAREVKLLGALLGQVIVEQAGLAALELVERVRRATIALRREAAEAGHAKAQRERLLAELGALASADIELLIRAFSLYFQLTNLAEEKQRVRRLRQRQRSAGEGAVDESVAAAVHRLRQEGLSTDEKDRLIGRLLVAPVLTAHPTEARRRTMLVALRRVYALLDRLDDPRLTPAEDADTRRRLREEITLLWHTSPIRVTKPSPMDEVRSAMAFFDESLFIVTPRLYRASAARSAFVRWGSWIGGDRDGNPNVTSEITRHTLRIQADHVLRAYERVCRRLMQTFAARAEATPALAARLATDERQLPESARELERRFPGEPFRRRLGYVAERLRRTRLRLTSAALTPPADDSAYVSPEHLAAELDELAEAMAAAGLGRSVEGELQDLRWQLDTFGFHGLSLEVRQHSAVHAATLDGHDPTGDTLATFAAMAAIQERSGAATCQRYVISFTRSAEDVLAVLELRRRALGEQALALDVVPLFESADALADCG
ncbi:MAG TPA: phosphoenolpyruvate carboxylase, partial [Candidatus Limnocylindrales bacterium]